MNNPADDSSSGSAGYRNEFAVQNWNNWLDFTPLEKVDKITAPCLMIESNNCAMPDTAHAFYNALQSEDKQLV